MLPSLSSPHLNRWLRYFLERRWGRRSSRCKVEEGKDVGGSIEGEKVASGMGKGVCLRGRGDVGELEDRVRRWGGVRVRVVKATMVTGMRWE